MTGLGWAGIVFAPLVPWPAIAALALLALIGVALALRARLRGLWLRAMAALLLLLALASPALRSETREPLRDIVLLLQDASASNQIGDRGAVTHDTVADLQASLAAMPNVEVRNVTIPDGADGSGTQALTAVNEALANAPANRIAGAILVTDGQAHDLTVSTVLPAPLNVLLTGHRAEWDRALKITKAPAFGIIGEKTSIGLRVDEQGKMPAALLGRDIEIAISVDGAPPQTHTIPVNRDMELPITLDHGGQNIVQFTIAASAGELTDKNNSALVQINGVRDRLRVLLISGEPYAGERTWRNLLKSDAAVDLVHFTILRPPEKDDGVPVEELSLIAFPTRELFVEKINEFDLILFDRYPLRGILPADYLDNIRDYVLQGGALLVAAGPDYASAESLFYSGVGDVMPAAPTTRVIEGPFLPKLSDLGLRHPVTEGLMELSPKADRPDGAPWGRWLRRVEVDHPRGQVLMEGPDQAPLLILNHEGKGRVALLASDQAWLWARGYEGGGPQQELLRRVAHWLMKEPELEEEALEAVTKGNAVTITRRSLTTGGHDLTITGPDGKVQHLALGETKPGTSSAQWVAPAAGLYHMRDGDLERLVAVGQAMPREFENAVASEAPLAAKVQPTNGGFVWLEDGGTPKVRAVRAGRPAAGRGWIGITPRGAYRTLDLRLAPLVPDWLLLLAALGLTLSAWLWEGRRRSVSSAQTSGQNQRG